MLYICRNKINSKTNLEGILRKSRRQNSEVDKDNLKYLYDDVFKFDELPKRYCKIKCINYRELFKDTNYNLKDVRKK